jgi:hypothetical protein
VENKKQKSDTHLALLLRSFSATTLEKTVNGCSLDVFFSWWWEGSLRQARESMLLALFGGGDTGNSLFPLIFSKKYFLHEKKPKKALLHGRKQYVQKSKRPLKY